ncbi:MAG: hypothetical protein WCA38_21695 [Candidatus Acidiferrales bacterium]
MNFVGLWSNSKTVTKQASIAGYKSGKRKTESCDFALMNVKVLGNVALMRDSDSEKNISCGKYLKRTRFGFFRTFRSVYQFHPNDGLAYPYDGGRCRTTRC